MPERGTDEAGEDVRPGRKRPPDAVPGDRPQPTNQPMDDEVVSEPLEDEEGRTYRIAQENVGGDEMEGGGEWPHPATPPRSPAPGAAEPRERGAGEPRERGAGEPRERD